MSDYYDSPSKEAKTETIYEKWRQERRTDQAETERLLKLMVGKTIKLAERCGDHNGKLFLDFGDLKVEVNHDVYSEEQLKEVKDDQTNS